MLLLRCGLRRSHFDLPGDGMNEHRATVYRLPTGKKELLGECTDIITNRVHRESLGLSPVLFGVGPDVS